MITGDDILSLNYYNYGQPFTGSLKGMRYRILKQDEKKDEAGEVIQAKSLSVVIWPEPFSFEKTDEAFKISRLFPFTEEGKAEVLDWLNQTYEQGTWEPRFTASGIARKQ